MQIKNPTQFQQELIDTIELSQFQIKEIFYTGSIGKVFFIKTYTPYRDRRVIILFNTINNTIKIYGESGKFIEVSYQKLEDIIYKLDKQQNNIKQIFVKEPPKKKIEKKKKRSKSKKAKSNNYTSNILHKKAVVHKLYSKVSEHKKPMSIDPIDSFLDIATDEIFDNTSSKYNTINNITFIKPKNKKKTIILKKETIPNEKIKHPPIKKSKVKTVRPRLKKEIIRVLELLTDKNKADIFMIELEMANLSFELQEYLSQFECDERVLEIHSNNLSKDIFIDDILYDIANKKVA